MKQITIIAAVDKKFALGNNNQLLCHLPNDLKRFKKITEGHTIIMGINTYYSLPKRPLPNRRNIVLTSKHDIELEGCLIAHSVNEVLSLCDNDRENFVIGGAMVYKQFLSIAQKLLLTHIDAAFVADTFFEPVNTNVWQITNMQKLNPDEKHPFAYTFADYNKINI
jgi:dihydrofolate reductase